MILEYVPVLKDYENEKGEIIRYTDAELLNVKAEAEQYLAKVSLPEERKQMLHGIALELMGREK